MSRFKTEGTSPEVQAVLGKCRSARKQLDEAERHRAAAENQGDPSRLLRAQHLEHRAMGEHVTKAGRTARARQLVAERRAKQATAKPVPTVDEILARRQEAESIRKEQAAKVAQAKAASDHEAAQRRAKIREAQGKAAERRGFTTATQSERRDVGTHAHRRPKEERGDYLKRIQEETGSPSLRYGAKGRTGTALHGPQPTLQERLERIRATKVKAEVKSPASNPAPPDLRPLTRAPGSARETNAAERAALAAALRGGRTSGSLPGGKGGMLMGAFKTLGLHRYGEVVAASNRVPIAVDATGKATPQSIRRMNRARRLELARKLAADVKARAATPPPSTPANPSPRPATTPIDSPRLVPKLDRPDLPITPTMSPREKARKMIGAPRPHVGTQKDYDKPQQRYAQAAREANQEATRGFKQQEVRAGSETVKAQVKGDLAVHKSRLLRGDEAYTITHVPTGLMLAAVGSMERAKQIASAVHARRINLSEMHENPSGPGNKKRFEYLRALVAKKY